MVYCVYHVGEQTMTIGQYRFEMKVTGYVKTEHFSIARIERELLDHLSERDILAFFTNIDFTFVGSLEDGHDE